MILFERKLSYALFLLCLPLLFLPKINLLSLSENETAGLRIDDIVLLFLCVLIFWSKFLLNSRVTRVEIYLFSFLAIGMLSFFVSQLLVLLKVLPTNPPSMFYVLRLLEYFLFFYMGQLAYQLFEISSILKMFVFWNAFLLVLQKFGAIGQFNIHGYMVTGDRVSGVASFPSEMGALLNVLFCYFLFGQDSEKNNRISYVLVLFTFFISLIALTGTRISIVAAIVAFLYRFVQLTSKRSFLVKSGLPILLVILGSAVFFFLKSQASLIERSGGLFSWNNLSLLGAVWDAQAIDVPREKHFDLLLAEEYDLSWWIRIHNWCYALKLYLHHPECYLQGIGPGLVGPALDGGILRIWVEYGLLGFISFWLLLKELMSKSTLLKWIVIAFLFNMLFYDAYLSYKLMSLFFFISGYLYVVAEENPVVLKMC